MTFRKVKVKLLFFAKAREYSGTPKGLYSKDSTFKKVPQYSLKKC